MNTSEHEKSQDEQFGAHFEQLLNQGRQGEETQRTGTRVKFLDTLTGQPFTVKELDNDVNINRSYIGMCPALIKALPVNFFFFLMKILNFVFLSVCCPVAWDVSKLFVSLKSGGRLDCGNYRGSV